MRIVTWNCCRRAESSALSALKSLDPTIACLQEIRAPSDPANASAWAGRNGGIGMRIWAKAPLAVTPLPMVAGSPWSIVPYRVDGVSPVTVLHAWTRYEHGYLRGLDEALTLYADLLTQMPCIVIGDLNANAKWDSPRKPVDFSRLAYRLGAQFGLVSAYHAHTGEPFGQEQQPTHYFRRHLDEPFHLDYCFLPYQWVTNLRHATVMNDGEWPGLSDHRPLVVDVDVAAS